MSDTHEPLFYASLVKGLLGYYYPCPRGIYTKDEFRLALNNSELKALWCDVYTPEQVCNNIARFGGGILQPHCELLYDYDVIERYRYERDKAIKEQLFSPTLGSTDKGELEGATQAKDTES